MTEGDIGAVLTIDPDAREHQLREELVRTWARVRVDRSEAGAVVGYVLFWHVTDEIHLLNVAVALLRSGAGAAAARSSRR